LGIYFYGKYLQGTPPVAQPTTSKHRSEKLYVASRYMTNTHMLF